MLTPVYPTPQHARAAEEITCFFSRLPAVDAVLLMGSCARGKAAPGSCLDILVLCRPQELEASRAELERLWSAHYQSHPVYAEMRSLAAFSHVDLDFINGMFDPENHDHGWTTGADEFELEVGNTLAYSAPLWEGGTYYKELCTRWLPYYAEDLRRERLSMALRFCRNNLAHIPAFVSRGLYFQCFKRFYHAFEEFLQALFISRSIYPIAYDKWVEEGIVDILGLPDLYPHLPRLFEISNFESQEILEKSRDLEKLVDEYIPEI